MKRKMYGWKKDRWMNLTLKGWMEQNEQKINEGQVNLMKALESSDEEIKINAPASEISWKTFFQQGYHVT